MKISCLAPPLFLSILLFTGCKKEESDPPIIPAPAPTDQFTPSLTGTQGVQMQVDGDVITMVHGGSRIPFYFADGVIDPPQSYKFYAAGIFDGSVNTNVFELKVGTLNYADDFFDPALFQQFFTVGPRTFGSTTAVNLSRVAIEYTDDSGVLWSTQQGSAMQNGSVFTFTEVATDQDDQGVWAKVIANFNCTVYNSSGASRTITNGELMLEFRDY